MGIGDNFCFFSGHGHRENGIDYVIPSDGHLVWEARHSKAFRTPN